MANAHIDEDNSSSSESESSTPCVFCERSDVGPSEVGETYTKDGVTVHQYCLYFSSGLCQNGPTEEGISGFLIPDILKEVQRAKRRLNCTGCKKRGGFVGCSMVRCRRAGHVPCLRKAGFLFQFYNRFEAYCPNHRPIQDPLDATWTYSSDQNRCCICLSKIECEPTFETLYCPSCKMFYHRDCLQRQAWSSGRWYFRCPICNSQEEFVDEMLRMGIDIPLRDAQWEESGRFRDLYELKRLCQAEVCSCPEGKTYFTGIGQFRMRKCTTCGQCIGHVACTRGKPSRCVDCMIPENQSPKKASSTPKRCTCSVCIARASINDIISVEGANEMDVAKATNLETDLIRRQSGVTSFDPEPVAEGESKSPVSPVSDPITANLMSPSDDNSSDDQNTTLPDESTTHAKRILTFSSESNEPLPSCARTNPFLTKLPSTEERKSRKRSSTIPQENQEPFKKRRHEDAAISDDDSNSSSVYDTPPESTEKTPLTNKRTSSSPYRTPPENSNKTHPSNGKSSPRCRELAIVVQRIPYTLQQHPEIKSDAKILRSRSSGRLSSWSSSRSSGSPSYVSSPLLYALYKPLETRKP